MADKQDESEQAKKDEIFVLSNIYPDTCKVNNDELTFEISEPEFNQKILRFQVRLIKSYPKFMKPDYTIVADWVPDHVIERIKNRLDEVWNQNLNEPVVYLWVEAVSECVLDWCKENESTDQREIEKIEKKFSKLNVKYKDKKNSQASTQKRFDFKYGQPFVFKKSVFQAHLLQIDDESEIEDARKQLAEESKRVQEATHNIMAYRIFKTINNRTIEHSNYDDDGETQAGSRLHLLLQLTDSKNVLIVVSRYFGGVKLGPDRFKYINEVAKVLLQEQGFICPKEDKRSKGKR